MTSHRYSVNGAVAKRGSATPFVLGVHVPPNSKESLTLGVVLHQPQACHHTPTIQTVTQTSMLKRGYAQLRKILPAA